MRTLAFVSILGGLALAPAAVQAQESGWYLGGSIGQSKTKFDDAAISSDLTALGITQTISGKEETDTSFKVFAGYRFNRYVAVEGSYLDLGAFSITARVTRVNGSAVPPQPLTFGIEPQEALSLAAVGSLPLGSSRFSLLGKLGMYSIKTEASLKGVRGGTTLSDRNQDVLVGLGASYDFNNKVGVRVEWERFIDVGSDDIGGKGDIDLMSVGLVYRF